MRKLIVSEFLTLDGVMEAPGDEPGRPHSGWVLDSLSPDLLTYKLDELLEAESLLIGRVTYEMFAGLWPQRTGAFADKMNEMPKQVVAATLRDPAWNNCHLISTDVVDAVKRFKQGFGGPLLVVGSRTLVHALLEHQLIDECRLITVPVVLGSGRHLFPENQSKITLRLIETRKFTSGAVMNTYVQSNNRG